jgi:hypothetical protein
MSSYSSEGPTTAGSGGEEQTSLFGAQDAAARLTEPLKREAQLAAERQKDHGADQLAGLAEAIRRAARELEPQLPQTAAYVLGAAGGLDRLASRLRSQSIGELAGGFRRVAHERPATVFAGAVLVGLVLTRVLKSSPSGTER